MMLVPALMHLLNRYIVQVRDFGYKATEHLAKAAWSVLNGLRTIHTFAREDIETRRFVETSGHVRSFLLQVALITTASAPVTEVMITAVVAIIALAIDASQVAVPTLIGFLAILYRLQPRVLALANLQSRLTALRTAVVEVTRVLDESATHHPPSGHRLYAGLTEGIRFSNVTFSYFTTSRPAVADLTFNIARGSTLAIVGSSGAGKSTLLDLLLRFQEPQQGSIVVDNVPLAEIDVRSWRSRVAIVNQDPYLFDDTVRGNILYGRPDATEDEVIAAARLACADEFIRQLPHGYETLIGERGTQISGGQRQRLSLARALIRDADILILDEATSALDAVTERALQHALKKTGSKRTTIIVAHRLSMIEMADHVIVLDNGCLVEQGSPAALLQRSGELARIFRPEREAV
jgi:subfamily B ATP-binding cassette protein MsbA